MIRKLHACLFLVGATLVLGSTPSAAADTSPNKSAFNISPLRLELASDEQATRMLVRNASKQPLAVQVRIFLWEQKDGKDVYSPSTNVAISPSIMKIDAERTQVFHVIARKSSEVIGEQRYRVVIDELPNQSKPGAGMAKTRLRMTLPLFVNSDSASVADLSYNITNGGLVVRNDGGRTARFSSLALKNQDGSLEKLPTKGPKYVMGGSEILMPLPSQYSCGDGSKIISGIVDKKKFDAVPAQNCS